MRFPRWRGVRAAFALLLGIAAMACRPTLAAEDDAGVDVAHPHGDSVRECAPCHTADRWSPAKIGAEFDHGKFAFALRGAHAAVPCADCHESLDFAEAPSDCVACHNDPHLGELGLDCARCHEPRSFLDRSGMLRSHSTTRFPLSGAHLAVDCDSCHRPAAQGQMRFVNTPLECDACHSEQYRTAADPDHVAAGFPQDCTLCHSTLAWDRARFDHANTAFPLSGAHRILECGSCHTSGKYSGIATDCSSCHRSDYDKATEPDHLGAGFPMQCEECHSTAAWSPANFDHGRTAFPLQGAHRAVACSDCHGDGVYAGKSSDCIACHKRDFEGAVDPNHRLAGFPLDCGLCHGDASWAGATFDHEQSRFPLQGAHRAAACNDCHGDGVFAGKSTDCYACHRNEYDTTRDPDHRAAGFPTACEACHGANTWDGADFDHASTGFALRGGHVGLACDNCHAGGVFMGTSTDCYACHRSDYDRTSDPNHRTAGFPTDCVACHTDSRWDGARFDHDAQYFPIYSGRHRGEWSSCATCHPSSINYALFDCLGCHPHSDRARTDAEHRERRDYTYDSHACLRCHPDGREE